jgi:hypothetical protein
MCMFTCVWWYASWIVCMHVRRGMFDKWRVYVRFVVEFIVGVYVEFIVGVYVYMS